MKREGAVKSRRVVAVGAVGVTAVLYLGTAVFASFNHHASVAVPALGVLGFAVIGGLIAVRQPTNRLGWLLAGTAIALAYLAFGQEYGQRGLVEHPGSLPATSLVVGLLTFMPVLWNGLMIAILPQLFPTGRVLGRRWRFGVVAGIGFIAIGVPANAFAPQRVEGLDGVRNPFGIEGAEAITGVLQGVAGVCLLVAVATGIASLAIRWRAAAGDERQQLKWFVAGVGPVLVPVLLHSSSPAVTDLAIAVLLPLVPITMGIAILRHRLYELDVLVRRTIVLSIVSVCTAGVYLAVVALASWIAGGASTGAHVLAAVSVAAVFQPLRDRVRTGLDRALFGDRSRPYEALAALGQRLEGAETSEAVLQTIVETVGVVLRVPYCAIQLPFGGDWTTAAEHGQPGETVDSFPMVYQGDVAGRLIVGRSADDAFRDEDRRLMVDLARQAGVAAKAVEVTAALQRSRVALVSAREEERRRLRRDLHDGLGPALAGVTLGLHAARITIDRDPCGTEALLGQLESQVEEVIVDIRRLVHGLRPPALDEFGLVRAIEQHAVLLDGGVDRIDVQVDSPQTGIGPLPAAVEVAAYRIAIEAMTNVARHSSAQRCVVRLTRDTSLQLEISDNGVGWGDDRPAGVGLAAMRERAVELGGELLATSNSGGTRVVARLPLPVPVPVPVPR
jgi:signal transduction histidine kinase